MSETNTGVQVVVRVRPLNTKEKMGNTLPIVNSSSQRNEVTLIKGIGFKAMRHTFNFDNVFNEFTTQQEVFEQTLAPLVSDVLKGFESTVFAYGQTGTGKTYTMEGEIDIPTEAGVIPRSCEAIFQRLTDPRYSDSSVRVSYLEIYNEELCDLLVDSSKANNLKICEDVSGKVICWGLTELHVTSTTEVLDILRSAQARRRVGETKMNKVSSRSHCLFSLSVTSKESVDGGSLERRGKLHLVDLAGSECAKATGADANSTRLRESQNINKSLLTLGRVITSLRDKTARIPYRDSKLTRLLQEALGGHSKTCIIATLSPSVQCADETLSTLKYAEKAHGIENKASQAFVRMSANGEPILDSMEGASDARTFSEMEQRMHYMELQCEEAQAALGRKHEEVAAMAERAEIAEEKVEGLMASVKLAEMQLKEQQDANTVMVSQLEAERLLLAQHKVFLQARSETEDKLRREATELLQCLDASVKNSSDLFDEVKQRLSKQDQVKAATRSMSTDSNEILASLMTEFQSFSTAHSQRQHALGALLESLREKVDQTFGTVDKNVAESFEKVKQGCAHIDQVLHTECTGLNEKVSAMTTTAREQTLSTAQHISKKATESLAEIDKLQLLHQQAETELKQWSEQTKRRLQAASNDIETTLSTHCDTLTQQHQAFEQDCEKLSAHLLAQTTQLQGLLSNLSEHITSQNATNQALVNTQQVMQNGSSQQMALSQSQHQTLDAALKEQHDVSLVTMHTHSNTLSQLASAVKASAQAQLQVMSAQLTALSSAVKEHQDNGIAALTTHSASISHTQTSLFNLISSQIENLRKQGKNLEDVLHNEQLLGGSTMTETQHLKSLQTTSDLLSSRVQQQLSLLSAQKNHLSLVLAENLEKGAFSSYQQHLNSLSQCQQHVTTSGEHQLGLLQHQKEYLDSTFASVKTGMEANQTQHTSTLAKTEKEFKQHTATQYSLLEAQNQALEATVTAQKAGQAILIENVMAGVQKLLTTGLQDLGAVFTNNMNTLVAKNRSLHEETDKLSDSFTNQTETMQLETTQWVNHEKDIAKCVEEIAAENLVVVKAINEMQKQFKNNAGNLVAETEKWNECDKAVVNELRLTVEENSAVGEEIEASLAAFKGLSSQLVDETEKWGAQDQAIAHRVEAIRDLNNQMDASEEEVRKTVGTHVAALTAETEKWGASNAAVFKELQKGVELNEKLQASQHDIQAQHMAALTTASTETETWGTSCKTTVDGLTQALKENEETQQMSSKLLHEMNRLLENAQTQITQSVAHASEVIVKEVNGLVSGTSVQTSNANHMRATGGSNSEANTTQTHSLSQQMAALTSKENEHLRELVDSRVAVSSAYGHHTTQLSAHWDSTSQLMQTSAEEYTKDLAIFQQSIDQAINNLDQNEVSLHRALLETAAQTRSLIGSTLKEQGSNLEQAASSHREGLVGAETALKQHFETSSASVASLSQRLESFCVNDVAMHSPADPAVPPSTIVFSRDLSQTPSEEVLLGVMATTMVIPESVTVSTTTSSCNVDEGVDENVHPDKSTSPNVSGGEDPKKKRRAFSDISNALAMEDAIEKDKLLKKPKAGTLPRTSHIKAPTKKGV